MKRTDSIAFRGRRARPLSAGLLAFAAVFALLLAGPATAPPARAQEQAQPLLPMVQLQAGIHLIRAELAADARTRSIGLMFRESLAPNHGMLFVFQEKADHCFWMRNTPLPLSIAFLDDDGTIINIEDMAPRTEDSHCAKKPVKFALEMEQGWFARRGIAPGGKLLNPKLFSGQR